jgi:Fur family ferric uptake transcriptional regulator
VSKNNASEKNAFEALLREKGLKYTHEREAIYKVVSGLEEHFDADTLFASVKKEDQRIARGTVYRTIPLLLESGVIQNSVGKGKSDFFERKAPKGHHDHMICVTCGNVVEYHCPKIETLQDMVCKKHSAKLLFHTHTLFVHCSSCVKKKSISKK